MIPQYTAASIVSLNKSLATPSSVDSIPSSQGQEDHVSMGANAAIKLYKVVLNTERVLAIVQRSTGTRVPSSAEVVACCGGHLRELQKGGAVHRSRRGDVSAHRTLH